jgi:repressor LexA
VTVKRYKRTGNRSQVELWPENPEFNVIHVDLSDKEFSIEGLSVGVIRRE